MPTLQDCISQLTCFKHVDFSASGNVITPIVQGSSHQCFSVKVKLCSTIGAEQYFVKYLGDRNTRHSEIALSKACATLKLSPPVIYHDDHWLVTEFIPYENLNNLACSRAEKVNIALTTMAKFHQMLLPSSIEKLQTLSLVELLYEYLHKPAIAHHFPQPLLHQIKAWLNIIGPEVSKQSQLKPLTLCHGDVNFSNLLVNGQHNQVDNSYLIDFECACYAPLEFDLAMFIAINNRDLKQINSNPKSYVSIYQKQTQQTVNVALLTLLLPCCYLLNGLWYLEKAQNNKSSTALTDLAYQQLHAFDAYQVVSITFSN